MNQSKEHRSIRDAFGQFATGVTVVTANSDSGVPIGLTANSFASVSLEPPLVSWCIDKSSTRFAELSNSVYFSISVLTEEQQEYSNLFATRSWDDNAFDELDWYEGMNGVPQIPNVAARFHCRLEHRYEGGDHIIIVGHVEDYESSLEQPLVFFQGNYRNLNKKSN